MFSEPLLAHPAKIGGVDATWHTHPGNDDDRDQHDDDADNEQHLVLAAFRDDAGPCPFSGRKDQDARAEALVSGAPDAT
jgi:hypothetical protein